MRYSAWTRCVRFPAKVAKRVNAYLDFAYFYAQPDGYYVRFTKPTVEDLKTLSDLCIMRIIVGKTTLMCKFNKEYLPDITHQITWECIAYKKKIYKLRLYTKEKQQLKFVQPELPPWLK